MFNTLKKRIKNEKGLSLVELLAVIVILAIVAAIAIPAIGNIINNQRDKAILAELSNAISTAKIAYVDGSCGDQGTCLATDIAFKSDKFTLTSVSSLNATNSTTGPTIEFTFAGTQGFKGEKFKVTSGVSEKYLNDVMQNGVTTTTPTPTS
ncbi:prepilin-type N-terminal cleavage/methylation domain-containing protein [Solibacillus sp. NPDC093137]|uniref:prepilin-type N-terminal cleavage/methylation domain-containing protein n=1 Tax=Solibacillus sp. NPDC093137 TaxID=3390678 RepID=UPI003D04EA18